MHKYVQEKNEYMLLKATKILRDQTGRSAVDFIKYYIDLQHDQHYILTDGEL